MLRRLSILVMMSVLACGCAGPAVERGPDCAIALASDGKIRPSRLSEGGLDLYYEVEGAGPALVLIHGSAHHGIFHPVMSRLVDRRTVVYYDRRGFGSTRVDRASPKPPPPGCETEDLERLRRVLALERFDLLALSAGGPVAIEYALEHPDRVRRLILLSTYADNDDRIGYATPLVMQALHDPERRARVRAIRTDDSLGSVEKDVLEFQLLPHPHHERPIPRGRSSTGCDPDVSPRRPTSSPSTGARTSRRPASSRRSRGSRSRRW
jgi:pimeloyl-ACP methyl ester carboxylesterase